MPPLTIWWNAQLPEPASQMLREGTRAYRLVSSEDEFELADVAFGQPDPDRCISSANLKWVHLNSAGYTRYDRDDLRAALRSRGAILTNSSSVYDEPCAQHVLAMMLAFVRQLPQSWQEQQTTRNWHYTERRRNSRLLSGQFVLMFGFGAIARRLVELLAPFKMNLTAVRRSQRGDEPVEIITESEANNAIARADHVVNILPDSNTTKRYFEADRFARMKPGALFYNIGRGTTVDQDALIAALADGHLAGAYLDVMDPEPLPSEYPLWLAPNCYITPHTGGGHNDEFERLVEHFLLNLERFTQEQPLVDLIMD